MVGLKLRMVTSGEGLLTLTNCFAVGYKEIKAINWDERGKKPCDRTIKYTINEGVLSETGSRSISSEITEEDEKILHGRKNLE